MHPDHFLILAFSDLHGQMFEEASSLIDEARPYWIVLCGDLLPDAPIAAQRDFWATRRSTFIRPKAGITLVRGNHEREGFEDLDFQRLPTGLERRVVRLEGTPAEFGAWGWSREWEEEELEEELRAQLAANPSPSIYLSHVPPHGCLDRAWGGDNIGHRPLFRHLRQRDWPEALVLCGHVHESFGSMECGETLVVNAACGYALLEWTLGTTRLLEQSRLEPMRDADWEF